jgi:hypothetical protein
MKHLLKNIILVAAFALNVNAASTAIISNQEATNAVVVNEPLVLDSITLFSTNAAPTIVYLYDGGITYTRSAWTNYVTYPTNQTYTYITSGGTTNTYTASSLYVSATVQAAGTFAATPMVTLVVPANGGLVSFTPPIPLVFATKLTLSNSLTGVSGTVSYRTP